MIQNHLNAPGQNKGLLHGLITIKILYANDISKAELLELAFTNLPPKKYKVDEEAKRHRLISYGRDNIF